jgi:hypothetical protein
MSSKKTTENSDVIGSPEPKSSGKKKVSKTTLNDDIIGSNIPVEDLKPAKVKEELKFTVAIHSTKNVIWEGVGKVEKGYNIVSKAEAERWLTRSHIRLATPEEVAREYGA